MVKCLGTVCSEDQIWLIQQKKKYQGLEWKVIAREFFLIIKFEWTPLLFPEDFHLTPRIKFPHLSATQRKYISILEVC